MTFCGRITPLENNFKKESAPSLQLNHLMPFYQRADGHRNPRFLKGVLSSHLGGGGAVPPAFGGFSVVGFACNST